MFARSRGIQLRAPSSRPNFSRSVQKDIRMSSTSNGGSISGLIPKRTYNSEPTSSWMDIYVKHMETHRQKRAVQLSPYMSPTEWFLSELSNLQMENCQQGALLAKLSTKEPLTPEDRRNLAEHLERYRLQRHETLLVRNAEIDAQIFQIFEKLQSKSISESDKREYRERLADKDKIWTQIKREMIELRADYPRF